MANLEVPVPINDLANPATAKIHLNPPTPFTGKRTDFVQFMQDIFVYLKINKHIYNDDDKRISLVLSYMTDGDAAIWKQQFIQTKMEEAILAGDDADTD